MSPAISQWMLAMASIALGMGAVRGCCCCGARGFCDARSACRPCTSSSRKSANSCALAVQPDQRSSATCRAASTCEGSQRAWLAIIPASHAVRSEWSVGWPMLRSPMKASARTGVENGNGRVVGHERGRGGGRGGEGQAKAQHRTVFRALSVIRPIPRWVADSTELAAPASLEGRRLFFLFFLSFSLLSSLFNLAVSPPLP
jgi:hypothetical protein